jgi:23S rRNA pseudouridine2457 synthase
MAKVYLFNKPFNVLSQFTDKEGRKTLADYINIPGIYPAGRLDYDSEGLLILTGDGELQARIADPQHKLPKTYWVQVEGDISVDAISQLEKGVLLKDGLTRPAKARKINPPEIWERHPPIRYRKDDTTSWIELTLSEGKNRQIRRMTAETGYPTLRLVRYSIGHWNLDNIQPGCFQIDEIHLPNKSQKAKHNPKEKNGKFKPRK